ncbi:hypothetical protein QTP86_029524, partial [Hemibagrus guttatus]
FIRTWMKDLTSSCAQIAQRWSMCLGQKGHWLNIKKELGKAYCWITFFMSKNISKEVVDASSEFNSDSEIVNTTRSTAKFSQADMVVS